MRRITILVSQTELDAIHWMSHRPSTYPFEERHKRVNLCELVLAKVLAASRKIEVRPTRKNLEKARAGVS